MEEPPYLDENQIFYQLIWKKDNPTFPRAIDEIYPWFSQAPVETYRAFGIEAEFRVVNDIITKEAERSQGKVEEISETAWSLWVESS